MRQDLIQDLEKYKYRLEVSEGNAMLIEEAIAELRKANAELTEMTKIKDSYKLRFDNEQQRGDELSDKLQRPHRVAITVQGGVADFEERGEGNVQVRVFDFDNAESEGNEDLQTELETFLNGEDLQTELETFLNGEN